MAAAGRSGIGPKFNFGEPLDRKFDFGDLRSKARFWRGDRWRALQSARLWRPFRSKPHRLWRPARLKVRPGGPLDRKLDFGEALNRIQSLSTGLDRELNFGDNPDFSDELAESENFDAFDFLRSALPQVSSANFSFCCARGRGGGAAGSFLLGRSQRGRACPFASCFFAPSWRARSEAPAGGQFLLREGRCRAKPCGAGRHSSLRRPR